MRPEVLSAGELIHIHEGRPKTSRGSERGENVHTQGDLKKRVADLIFGKACLPRVYEEILKQKANRKTILKPRV